MESGKGVDYLCTILENDSKTFLQVNCCSNLCKRENEHTFRWQSNTHSIVAFCIQCRRCLSYMSWGLAINKLKFKALFYNHEIIS